MNNEGFFYVRSEWLFLDFVLQIIQISDIYSDKALFLRVAENPLIQKAD